MRIPVCKKSQRTLLESVGLLMKSQVVKQSKTTLKLKVFKVQSSDKKYEKINLRLISTIKYTYEIQSVLEMDEFQQFFEPPVAEEYFFSSPATLPPSLIRLLHVYVLILFFECWSHSLYTKSCVFIDQ